MQLYKWFSNIIFHNTVYSLIEMGIPALLMLVSTPFLLSGMGAASYGLWSLGLAFLGLIGLADIGIGAATTKFIAEYVENNDIKGLSEIITISFAITLFVGTIFTGILLLLSSWIASFFISSEFSIGVITFIFQICIFGLFAILIENIGLAIPRGFQDYRTTTILLSGQNVLTILFAVWIVFIRGTITQIFIGMVIIVWCFAIGSLVIALYRVRKRGINFAFSLNTFHKFIDFMFFMGLTGIGLKIFSLFDRVVVAQTLGLEVAAYYSIATGIANKFTAFGTAATQALFPAFSSWYVNKEKNSIWEKLKTATLLVGIGSIVPGCFLLVFSQPLVYWWLGKQNGSAVLIPLQILILVYMVKTVTAPSYQAANGLGFPWMTWLTTIIGSFGTIGLIIILGKSFGFIGAAWANIAIWVNLSLPIFLYYKIFRKKYSVNPLLSN